MIVAVFLVVADDSFTFYGYFSLRVKMVGGFGVGLIFDKWLIFLSFKHLLKWLTLSS